MVSVSLSKSSRLYFMATTVFFVFLMCLSSFVRIPLFFTPVPLTLQTLVLFLSVIFLEEKSIYVQAIYLTLGITGLPVFGNGGAGLVYLLGPTGGYLLGFVLSSFLAGKMIGYTRKEGMIGFVPLLCMFSLATGVIYTMGLVWLTISLHISFSKAFYLGVLPFFAGDSIKVFLAAAIGARVSGART